MAWPSRLVLCSNSTMCSRNGCITLKQLTRGLQPESIRQHAILLHDGYSVPDDAGFILAAVLDVLLVDDPHVLSQPAILIENCPFDVAAAADAQMRQAAIGGPTMIFVEIVGPHDHGVFDRDPFADNAPQADHAVLDVAAAADLAAVGHQAVLHDAVVKPCRRQKARPAVNRG